ncbi:MAG: 2-oxoacid:ferredoxin oxidoreductase subunit beta, partial [Actinomycetota bacterium]
VFRRAAAHKGSAFIEVYQNCNVFNDGAFEDLTSKEGKELNQVRLEHGKPIRFGPDGAKGLVLTSEASLEVLDVADVGEENLLVHDEHRIEPSLAFLLAHMSSSPHEPTPIGIFRDVDRPVYEESMQAQIAAATEKLGPGDIAKLLRSGDTWEIS